MKTDLVYVERVNGTSHDGEAWIGKCFYSKSRLSIYFDGKAFKKEKSFSGNYYDLDSGEAYWISGIKKNGNDRHRFGKGIIKIDKSVVADYLKIINEEVLQKNKFNIVELNNIPAKEKATEIENEKSEKPVDLNFKAKDPKNLTDDELSDLIEYYNSIDLSQLFKNNRKGFKQEIKNLSKELLRRESSNLA